MKFAALLLPLIAFLFIGVSSVFAADIVINEFSPKSTPEWVELYNTTDNEIRIIDWKLRDTANTTKDLAPVCIPSHGFYTFEDNSNGWLNNTGGDSISLLDEGGNVVDSVTYGNSDSTIPSTPSDSLSASRVPDGGTTWQVGASTRQDTSNSCPPDPTPTPNPTPSTTPTPATSPTPKPTTSPTPTPIKPPSPTPKPTPKSSPSPSSETSTVLGEASETNSSPNPSASPEAEPVSSSLSKTKAAAIITGAGAILIALSLGFYLWYSKLLGHEKAQEFIEVEQTDKPVF